MVLRFSQKTSFYYNYRNIKKNNNPNLYLIHVSNHSLLLMNKQLIVQQLRLPLKSNSRSNNSDSQNQQNEIDVIRIMNRRSMNRQSKILASSFDKYRELKTICKNRISQKNEKLQSFDQEHRDPYSNIGNRGDYAQKVELKSGLTQDETFITTYENSNIIGCIIYILFLMFLIVEIIITSELLSDNQGYLPDNVLMPFIIYLSAEFLHNFVVKSIFSSQISRKYDINFRYITYSLKRFLSKSNWNEQAKKYKATSSLLSKIFQMPRLILCITITLVIISDYIFVYLIVLSSNIFQGDSSGYFLSTIFWVSFGLPCVFSDFYLNRPFEQKTTKLKIFPFIITGYLIQTSLEGILCTLLGFYKIILQCVKSKNSHDFFIIEQLAKCILLLTLVLFSIFSYFIGEEDYSLYDILKGILFVCILSLFMLLTRIIGLKYIKNQLYKYFFTESYLTISFIISTALLSLSYLKDKQNHIYLFISSIFLGILGILVFMEGRQNLEIKMEKDQLQQKV